MVTSLWNEALIQSIDLVKIAIEPASNKSFQKFDWTLWYVCCMDLLSIVTVECWAVAVSTDCTLWFHFVISLRKQNFSMLSLLWREGSSNSKLLSTWLPICIQRWFPKKKTQRKTFLRTQINKYLKNYFTTKQRKWRSKLICFPYNKNNDSITMCH